MDHRRNRPSGGQVRRRLVLSALPLGIAAGIALWLPPGGSASANVPHAPQGATTIAGMVALSGSLHPQARRELDIGQMDPGMRLSGLSLLFRMSPQQRALLKHALAAVQDPASPSYHQWLTPEQYAAQFGASPSEVARATAWLTSQGLGVDGASRTATRLTFHGTVGQIEHAFRTEMHRYRVDGETHLAMSQAPSVPGDLADLVLGVHGLHDFRAKPRPSAARPLYALPITGVDGGPAAFPVMAPPDFATIYDVDSLYAAHITGAGQSIAVAEESDFNDADVQAFRTTFNLPLNPPVRVLVPNSGNAATNLGLYEAELDLEWSGAVAPAATIKTVFTGDAPNADVFDAMIYAIEERAASVLSISYGWCESWFTPADAEFEGAYGDTASLEGMTVVVASGDTGAAACDDQSTQAASYGEAVIFPASVPNFVAVGGSQFRLTASNQSNYLNAQLSALSYIPEAAWNETLFDIDAGYGGLGAGGGGMSRLFAKPAWQAPYTPNDGFRDLPDVAMSTSADVLPYAVSISWTAADGDAQAPQPQALTAYGGTSVAAPSFAGILALLNQALTEANPATPVGLGNANPMLYALANNPTSKSAFHDITSGDNVVPCRQGSPGCPSSPPYQFGYTAGPGYDQATGLGSIDAANLVAAWEALTPTSTALHVTPSGTTAGSSLHLSATIASKATANAMTGFVTFYFVASGDGGVGVSGTLGSGVVSASTSSGAEEGTASLTTSAPGGLAGTGATIGAFFGGDDHYLASWSTFSPVSGSSNLAICPTAITLSEGQKGFTFTTSGGSPPIQWGILRDKTCAQQNERIACSSIDGGAFVAGPKAGSAIVVAMDQDESYVTAEVLVADAGLDGATPPPTSCGHDGGPVDGGSPGDSQLDAGADAQEAGNVTAPLKSPQGSAGCGCVAAGIESRGSGTGWASAALMALAVAARALSRHRQHRRNTPRR